MTDVSFQACADDAPYLLWGTIWDPVAQSSDWAVSTAANNPGGFEVGDPIATAVIIGLLTDRRCPSDHPLAKYADGDPRGWWGDGVDVRADLCEDQLGSLLWLLERATATEDNRRWAETFALDGLTPLLACGAARMIVPTATLYPAQNAITLDVRIAGCLGGVHYDRNFEQVWTSRT